MLYAYDQLSKLSIFHFHFQIPFYFHFHWHQIFQASLEGSLSKLSIFLGNLGRHVCLFIFSDLLFRNNNDNISTLVGWPLMPVGSSTGSRLSPTESRIRDQDCLQLKFNDLRLTWLVWWIWSLLSLLELTRSRHGLKLVNTPRKTGTRLCLFRLIKSVNTQLSILLPYQYQTEKSNTGYYIIKVDWEYPMWGEPKKTFSFANKRKFLSSWKQPFFCFVNIFTKVKTTIVSKLTITQTRRYTWVWKRESSVYLSIHTGHEFHNHKKAGLGINNRQNRSCLTKAR